MNLKSSSYPVVNVSIKVNNLSLFTGGNTQGTFKVKLLNYLEQAWLCKKMTDKAENIEVRASFL